MDAADGLLTLTPAETEELSRLAEGSQPDSSRAKAILSLAESDDLDRAVDLSGLTVRQVAYWRGRFRSGRLPALMAARVSTEDSSAKAAAHEAEPTDATSHAGPERGLAESTARRAKKGRKSSGKNKQVEPKDKKAGKAAAKGGKKTGKDAGEPAKGKKSKKAAKKPAKRSTKADRKNGKKKTGTAAKHAAKRGRTKNRK